MGRPRNIKIWKVCEICGSRFHPMYSKAAKNRFCSRQCMGKWQSVAMKGKKNHRWTGGKKSKIGLFGRTPTGQLDGITNIARGFVRRHGNDEYMLRQGIERWLKEFPLGFFDAEYDYNVDKIAEMVLGRR